MDVKSSNSKEEVVRKLPKSFTFKEIAEATGNFMLVCSLGERGFGKVYKGLLYETNQVIAVKQFDPNGFQGMMGFIIEVMPLIVADHPNLVNLIGFCVVGDQRLLVYEFMPFGSLDKLLHDLPPQKKPLDWNTRMKIAAGTARGLEYLHNRKHPIVCGDLKCSKILLGEGYHPKISGYGLAKVEPNGENSFHVSTKNVMGTPWVPGNAMTCQKTLKSDIYSFGVVLLELITGRKAFDDTRDCKEHDMVAWARPLLADRQKLMLLVDPLLQGEFPLWECYEALTTAAMCVQEQPEKRPVISDVAMALNYFESRKFDPSANSSFRNTGENGSPAAGADDSS